MRFSSTFLTLAGLATTVLAQTPFFGAPQNMAQVLPGDLVLISVEQGDTNSQFENVAIALGIAQCFGACPGANNAPLGDVFYNGLYETTPLPSPSPNRFQNFTVTIPSYYEAGTLAQVTAALFTLVGAAAIPDLETIAITLQIL